MVFWTLKDRVYSIERPLVMGILNATPDSFHAESRTTVDDAVTRAEQMLAEGADIIDIGGMSSRPGSEEVPSEVELDRVIPVIAAIHERHPDALLSVDTYRAVVAEAAVSVGARMVNDIGAGRLDERMMSTVAALRVPYVMMHMLGTPATMQQAPGYHHVVNDVVHFLSERMAAACDAGIADVIIDPGFGFGKTTEHNLALFNGLTSFAALGAPLLVGISRKRMINEVLGTTSQEALNGTTVLNALALQRGAAILRVHDVLPAKQAVLLHQALSVAEGSELHFASLAR
ncbi:MAG: dihydropteroate synthase [Flavobacteriales bacterium]|nr:dihydropteroate synthase [Flavobacteriales bacterium]